MLRLVLCLLWAVLLCAGQAMAEVTVVVDMKQTGPVVNGVVQPRVGKNIAATYSASASYNGTPTLHDEEEVTGEAWTHTVTASSSDVNYSPTGEQSGNAVGISASSAKAGTYTISVTFSVTFTIKTPVKDSNGNYQYNSDGTQQFTTRTNGPYSGSGSATLNVKNGKFEVKIKPNDLIEQFAGDTNGYRNKVGIGETINVCVFPETGTSDSVSFDHVVFNQIQYSQTNFKADDFPGTLALDVYAKVNGFLEGPESIGVTVIEPSGAGLVRKIGSGVGHTHNTGSVSFYGMCYLTPGDVSFAAVSVYEDTCPSTTTGYYTLRYGTPGPVHPLGSANPCDHNIDPYANRRNVFGQDNISSDPHHATQQLPFSEGTFTWTIPWIFQCGTNKKQIATMTHRATINASGDMTISKGGVMASAKFSDPTSSR